MKLFTTTRTLALMTASVAALATVPADAQQLRLGDFQSTTHIVSKEGTTRWIAAVEEATEGAVTFQHFPSEQAARASALMDAVENGILDVALVGTIYHGETLPMNSIVGLPGFYGSAVEGTKAIQAMLAEGPLRDEILETGVVPLFGFVLPPYQVLAQKRLGMPDDWRNLNIRTAGSTQAMTARSLGSVGVSIPGPEVYTAVERGRLDGILFPLASVAAYNLQEVVTHISQNGSFGGYSFVMVARKEMFENLPEDVQLAMIEQGNEVALHVARAQDDSIAGFLADWAAQGVDIYSLSDNELEALSDAMTEVAEDWFNRIGRGSDTAREVLERYRDLTGG
ncbi:TRAP transporter substrate-binding protein DctP [Roseinatronobacter alkalisoli]|uniref:TRAP transporter substrate-binding protein DctP n=1 Tax=Roseinatronobacter alkalisoli TaxID=3028235 RepID=A0ABT5TEZ7_9RHOB|nr:TRAP transporter substrate-binding protein DctP [Roseinatronobacter sp. HJB301]MDD7973280.1 TRAP transporter substrate-binding protein DctP [Roseinatronobacter sp. HJB301]